MTQTIGIENDCSMTDRASLVRNDRCHSTESCDKGDTGDHSPTNLKDTQKHDSPTEELPEYLSVNGIPTKVPSESPDTTETDSQFWKAELASVHDQPHCSFARSVTKGGNADSPRHTVTSTLGKELSSDIRHLSLELGVPASTFLLGAFSILLSRTLDTENDFCIALAVHEEPSRAKLGTSFLPLKITPRTEESAKDVITKVFAKQILVAKHAGIDSTAILAQTPGKAAEWTEFIPASFDHRVLEQNHATHLVSCNVTPTINLLDARQSLLGLSLKVSEAYDASYFHVELTASSALYTPREAELFLQSYTHVVRSVTHDPTARRTNYSLFDAGQGMRDVSVGKGQTALSDWPHTLLHKIDEVALDNPSGVALKDSSENELTYHELILRVSTIASSLLPHKLSRGDRVAVYCEASIDSVCALLAITRIGCIYVPLDIRNPPERILSIVHDCDPRVVIYHDPTEHLTRIVSDCNAHLVNVTANLPATATHDIPAIESRPEDPAFVLYTSGSTGKPKGVILSHENFFGQITAFHAKYSLGQERVLQQSSLGFDTSLHQTFIALTTGGTLVIAKQDIRGDPDELSKLMLNERITFTLGVVSEYLMLLRHGTARLQKYDDWKYAVCGGERMTASLKQNFRALEKSGLTLINVYGPTEVALAATSCVVPYMQSDTDLEYDDGVVGSPYSNYSVYVLDEQFRPAPHGFSGEVFIGGVGVACGYLGNTKLSEERFLQNPFVDDDYKRNGWTRMYKTGDKGRLLPDGSLTFLGRIDGDSQVKLRGIRIELEEIAGVILETSKGTLHQAAVVVKGPAGHEHMIAFVTFSPGQQPQDPISYLQSLLKSLPLPIYMRPASLIPQERMPTNINGKLDRKRLHEIAATTASEAKGDHRALDVTEKKLADIWTEVLELQSRNVAEFQISPDSDFFQVGGNSLLLIEIKKRIFEIFGVSIRLPDLFSASILGEMAAKINRTNGKTSPTVIDWATEIQNFLDRARMPIEDSANAPKEVLLTGSTGFLGSHLLRSLIEDPAVAKIHAVAVRSHHLREQPSGQGHVLSRFSSPKLRIWHGDLQNSNLGLSDVEVAELADRVDIIIHNGADVSFLKSYQSLRAPNVGSTVELCRIAAKRKIPFHFVSSAGVLRLTNDMGKLDTFSMAAFCPPTDGSDGYIASKWMAEQILEHFAKSEGIPVHIHRPTSITGDGTTDTDLMANILHYSRLMQAVPEFPDATGVCDLVPVEEVAEGILTQALGLGSDQVERLRGADRADVAVKASQIHLHSGKTQIPVDALDSYVKEVGGLQHLPQKVHLSDWITQAVERGLTESVASLLSTPEAARGHGMTIPRLHK